MPKLNWFGMTEHLMTPCSDDSAQAQQADLARLTGPKVLGFYTHFEVTEIFGKADGQGEALNLFSILVAENYSSDVRSECKMLNDKRIQSKLLPGWNFGVVRYTRPVSEVLKVLPDLHDKKSWALSGKQLNFGHLKPGSRIFVPPDGTDSVPLNRVLKNNFWNGSHVFEWFDEVKTFHAALFEDSRRLLELSDEIKKYVPISLGSLSDRIGNLIIQLPVRVIMSQFLNNKTDHDFNVKVAWADKATSRKLQATCEMMKDRTFAGYASKPLQGTEVLLKMNGAFGPFRGTIWDEQNEVILAATSLTGFINTFSFQMNIAQTALRTFSITQSDGTTKQFQIPLQQKALDMVIGNSDPDKPENWIQRRVYGEEAARLAEQQRFIQYRPVSGTQQREREKALKDVRQLINKHGQEGVWLWDPFLSADDILETIAHCMHWNSDLRALTAGQDTPGSQVVTSDFVSRQQTTLNSVQSNWEGLKLEYRRRHGPAGWGFHDRFLIFPKSGNSALVWSLGTSVNSLGTAHHILQQIDDGQLIMDAFVDLWELLVQPEHFIWKKP